MILLRGFEAVESSICNQHVPASQVPIQNQRTDTEEEEKESARLWNKEQ
jgi:hypothetical protein